MGRHCAGRVVLFTMSTEKGEDGYDRVDGHTSRGNAAFVLQQAPEGELIVLRHGPRTMPVLYTHLIPATFGGKARMNVANALAAAAAAWAAGAHLHDIRQGLRTFSTSFFQAPGRLNLLDVGGIRVVIDYCHNVDGMRQLADFVERMMAEPHVARPAGSGRPRTATARTAARAIGVIGIPGDRRDDDQREYGAIAATRVRRDHRPRGQEPPRPGARRVGRQRRRGRPRGRAARRARAIEGREDPRGDGARSGRRCAGPRRATSSCAASTTRSGSTARRWPRPARRAARPRSPTRASSRRRRDEPGPGHRATSRRIR